MKKLIKSALLGGTIFLLAGCRNQVNRNFMNRFVELQENTQSTASFKISDIGFAGNEGMGLVGPYLEAVLGQMDYQMTTQKDSEDPSLMHIDLGINVADEVNTVFEGFIQDENFLLNADQYFMLQSLTGSITQAKQPGEQVFEDYSGTYVSLESETAEEADVMESLSALRKGFLNLDPELFTETEDDISVTLGKEELVTLFAPLMMPPEGGDAPDASSFSAFMGEDATAEVILTVGKETESFTADLLFDQVDFNQLNKLGLDVEMSFADVEETVTPPAEDKVVPESYIINLLQPLHEGASPTGYTDAVFQEVLKRVESEREQLDRGTGRELLDVYQVLLTEEQYQELERVVDIPSLSVFYEVPEDTYEGPYSHSTIGIGSQRFEALLESTRKYRDNHTKESAQETLDQYYSQLTEEQYKLLEEVLDIETLPE